MFAFGEAGEFVGFGEGEGEGFFAHDVEAREEGGACNFVVRIVGRANDEEVNFAALGRDEVLPVWVAAGGVEAEGFGGFGVGFGAAREAASDEVSEVIHADGHAMDGADKTAAGTTDHGVGEATIGRFHRFGRLHRFGRFRRFRLHAAAQGIDEVAEAFETMREIVVRDLEHVFAGAFHFAFGIVEAFFDDGLGIGAAAFEAGAQFFH